MEITKKRRQRHWRQTDLEHKTLKSGHNIPWKQQTCLRFWKFQIIVNVTEEENIQPSWKGNRQQQAVSNKTTLLWVFKEWRLKLLWRFLHLPLPMVPASLLKTIYLKEREKEFFTCVVKIQNSLFMSFGRLKISHLKNKHIWSVLTTQDNLVILCDTITVTWQQPPTRFTHKKGAFFRFCSLSFTVI